MNSQSGTDTNTQGTGFSEDYVKQLREEAATWRTKFRELESTSRTKDIELVLSKKNIKAKASWVEVQEGQSIEEAVENFTKEFPHLVSQETPPVIKPKVETIQKSIKTNTSPPFTPPQNRVSNVEVKDLNQILKDQSINDVKTDPKSRSQVREWYQSALRGRQ